jgi:hypothetical protein
MVFDPRGSEDSPFKALQSGRRGNADQPSHPFYCDFQKWTYGIERIEIWLQGFSVRTFQPSSTLFK